MTNKRWSPQTMTLHWLAALVLVSLTAIGKYMADLPPDASSRLWLTRLHVLLGCVLVIMTGARLWFRSVTAAPVALGLPKLQKLGLSTVHFMLYALTLGVMASGLATAVSDRWLGYLRGQVDEAPALAVSAARAVHENLAFSLLSLLALHIGAVVMAELQYGKTLERMLPENDAPPSAERDTR